jgi:spore germination protein KB
MSQALKRELCVTGRQIGVATAACVYGSNQLMSFFQVYVHQDSWLAVMLGMAMATPVLLIYIALSRAHPGQNLIGITRTVLGKYAGTAVCALYLLGGLALTAFNIRRAADFIQYALLPEVALPVAIAALCALALWAGHCGLKSLLRLGPLLLGLGVVSLAVLALMLIPEYQWGNLLPMLRQPPENYLKAGHIAAVIPLCETLSFVMFLDVLKPGQSFGKPLMLGCLAGSGLMCIAITMAAAVLGPAGGMMNTPLFQMLRLIRVGAVFTRMEFLFSIPTLLLYGMKFCIFFMSVLRGGRQLLRLEDDRPLLVPLTMLCGWLALVGEGSPAALEVYGATVAVVFGSAFEIVLPAATLCVYGARRMLRRKGAGA